MVLTAAGFWYGHTVSPSAVPATAQSRFWATIFDPQRPTLIVPADSGLILMEELTGTAVQPADYMNRKYLDTPAPPGMAGAWNAMRNSQYTNMADLNMVSRLERIPKASGARVRIRFNYKRVIQGRDLQENVVLKPGDTIVVP